MSMFYKAAYSVGLTPWEQMASLPIAGQIASLFDREERERQAPYVARRGPLPHGMGRTDIEGAFPEWKLVGEDAADVSGAPGFIKKAKPCFYRLRHE